MQLLGNYNSELASFHFQELVSLLQQAIQAGDFGGGTAFNQAALDDLQKQAADFAALPVPAAGQIVTDESFNHPLRLLTARFAALIKESNSFSAQLKSLLSMLDKETILIDQLIAQATLEQWASTIPSLTGATPVMWDFGVGYGPVADTGIVNLWSDPSISVTYLSRPPLTSQLGPGDSAIHSGMAPASSVVPVLVNNLAWTYAAGDAQVEVLAEENWTKLTLLDPAPLINYSPAPVVTPAASPFLISGTSNLGSLPVYVQTSFVPRRQSLSWQAQNNLPVSLSGYPVDADQVIVFTGFGTAAQNILAQGTDYTIDDFGFIRFLTLDGLPTVTVFFAEEFPAYQCSVDQVNWSILLMLDPDRPYPDTATSFPPVPFVIDKAGNRQMPVTDELGNPTGLSMQMTAAPRDAYLLQAYSQASPDTVGATAVLEVDFAQLAYINALRVTPFTTFPMVLKKIEVQGLTSNTRKEVWRGSVALDRPTSLRLDQQIGINPLVSKAFLTFYQPNYGLKKQTVTPPDALRRDVMRQLQSILPFNARNVAPPQDAVYTGAQYEFGVEAVVGQFWDYAPGVFVSGPVHLEGCPELFRFDASVYGATGAASVNSLISSIPSSASDFYLCFRAFNTAGTVIDENLVGVALSSSSCGAFPLSGGVTLPDVASVDVYIKIVPRAQAAIIERYLLQVTLR